MTKDELIEKWKPKLDDKIKALNSSRVFKKVTPKGDLSWYVKWASSIIIILGMVSSSANIYAFKYLGTYVWCVRLVMGRFTMA